MRACSLQEFMEELKPWLDSDHIRNAQVDEHGHFILHFMDGMKNVYEVSDCDEYQLKEVIQHLRSRNIPVEE